MFYFLACELENAVGGVDEQKDDALYTAELAADESGEGEKTHNDQHNGNVHNEGSIHAGNELLGGNCKGAESNGSAADQNKVEDVCSDDVTQRKSAVTLYKRGDSGYKLGERSAKSNKGEVFL